MFDRVRYKVRGMLSAVVLLGGLVALSGAVEAEPADYPAASLTPRGKPGWDSTANQIDPSAPPDEAQGGRTEAGTPITTRNEDSFPAEYRDVFHKVDQVIGPDGKLRPLNYAGGGEAAEKAIRGKNTWILWGEGNEVFWDWVQQHGYGLADFLILMDSRRRGTPDKPGSRFKDLGVINQPGMVPAGKDQKILGLYLDQADGGKVRLNAPEVPYNPYRKDEPHKAYGAYDPAKFQLFEPYDENEYKAILSKLAHDGLDPNVYGYPSGIVGLRLMPNPNFFAKTDDAAKARQYWKKRVEDADNDAYYTNSSINADPKLVRPFRVSMSCGFCHIGPHPLNPPKHSEYPEWGNLSSTIGAQYWKPVSIFTNLKGPSSFLHQFIASQQPGTIDTSLVSTDHINNANTMNAIFAVPTRLKRAQVNAPEKQGPSNLLIPHPIGDEPPGVNPRHTPRVLLDGSDSVGVFGALSRVYLNIGAYSEEWKRLHNTVVGFTPQRPFAVATALKNSVYWRSGDKYRIPYLAAFFTYEEKDTRINVTAPMRLANVADDRDGAREAKARLEAERDDARKGRQVFLENCAVCHSSQQPPGVTLRFARNWREEQKRQTDEQKRHAEASRALTLPMDFADWREFVASPAFVDYVKQIKLIESDSPDQFVKDNLLSTDVRVPITLVGTNSGRGVATNAMRGQIWDNFSSEDYKTLPAVGDVRFFNPFSGTPVDSWGNNDSYAPPGGGPGYYRPPSLISLWATGPYLHNNSLGTYTLDPSVAGRLKAFDDGIDKLLWNDKRYNGAGERDGDLRKTMKEVQGDVGFVYRTTQKSWLDFPSTFIEPLITGVLGSFWTKVLTTWLWVGLAVGALLLAIVGRTRHAGFVFALVAVLVAVVLRMSRIDSIHPMLWVVPAVAAALAALLWFVLHGRWIGRTVFLALAVVVVLAGVGVSRFVDGKHGPLMVGPVPAGTPVNLLMNINPEASKRDLLQAAFAATRGLLRIRKENLPDGAAWEAFKEEAAAALMRVSKCPDFVLDRGHWFGEHLTDDQKKQLKAFLLTL